MTWEEYERECDEFQKAFVAMDAGLVTLLPAPEPAPAGVANRKDGTKH
jgi:hypothetical protein